MKLGPLLLRYYHTPVGRMRDSLRNGGPWAERETERQRREMVAAADRLPTLPLFADTTPVVLHLMSGDKFWYQTVFCLHSFAHASRRTVHAVIHDDGSMDDACVRRLSRLGPGVVIRRASELQAQLERLLPPDHFPVLRERWENYPNLRKLIDVHLGSTGWKLVLDSDLLFFRSPDFILEWLAAPDRPLHAVDCAESYGYSRSLLTQLAGTSIPPLVNVGLCGLRSEQLDWEELEAWTRQLQERERTNYYLEQALVAMLVARQSCAVAPAHDYLTRPNRTEVLAPTAVMHHYVAQSKRWYFRHGWRHLVRS